MPGGPASSGAPSGLDLPRVSVVFLFSVYFLKDPVLCQYLCSPPLHTPCSNDIKTPTLYLNTLMSSVPHAWALWTQEQLCPPPGAQHPAAKEERPGTQVARWASFRKSTFSLPRSSPLPPFRDLQNNASEPAGFGECVGRAGVRNIWPCFPV